MTSIIISIIALIISALTFWLTRIKRGIVRMTRPTVIFFGPDGSGSKHNKIFIRTLLYSTSDRGQYIENMFIRLHRGESVQNFNIWVYDDKGLVRGSGLFVGKSGIACNHHFLLPKDEGTYSFQSGEYLLEVFVEAVARRPEKIFTQMLKLGKDQATDMLSKNGGIYFDWAPNTQSYSSHVDIRPKYLENPSDLKDLFDKIQDR
jgi:hypothetical protein